MLGKNHCFKILFIFFTLVFVAFVSIFLFPKIIDLSTEKVKTLHIIFKIRLPQTLIAVTVGAALGLSGAIMQIILGNSLASPFTLGISSASAFGAALAIIAGINWLIPEVSAFIFSMGSLLLLLSITSFVGMSQRYLILVGIVINFFFSSANTLIQYYATPDAVYQIMFWTAGSLTNARINDSLILLIILSVATAISALFSRDLGLIQQGDKNAVMLGVNVNLERVILLALCSLLTSFSVSVVGIIGFIGLVAPHIARMLKIHSPKALLISSMLLGAFLLVVSDIISKTVIYPIILPIGAVTSFLGIPLLLFLLFLSRKDNK